MVLTFRVEVDDLEEDRWRGGGGVPSTRGVCHRPPLAGVPPTPLADDALLVPAEGEISIPVTVQRPLEQDDLAVLGRRIVDGQV